MPSFEHDPVPSLSPAPRRRRALRYGACAAAATLLSLTIQAQPAPQRRNFDQDISGVTPYHRDAPQTRVEHVPPAGAEPGFLRLTLPGQRKLEGANLSIGNLQGGRLATLRARVRGNGELWLCLRSRAGWLYSRSTIPLDATWQTVELGRVLQQGERTLGVSFLSRDVQTGAVFDVADISVSQDDLPAATAAEVPPIAIAPALFARAGTAQHSDAGSAVTADRYLQLDGIPFPRTTTPVFVYAQVRGFAGDRLRLFVNRAGYRQALHTLTLKEPGAAWHRLGPLHLGEALADFGVEILCAAHPRDDSAVSGIVISSDGALDSSALAQAAQLDFAGPYVRVGQTATAPRIDGKGDDPCWQTAVGCTDFRIVGANRPADVDTLVRFAYDRENLYVLAHCPEPVLDVRSQQTHEFRAEQRTHDSEVYRDSSLMLLLGPSGDAATLYDITVNALGTVADARCTAPDYWGTRDLAWNGEIRAAGTIEDGYWQVEIAIPFAGLGVAPPSPGSHWQLACGRIARKRGETSSWNPSGRGFHLPETLAQLEFATAAHGVTLDAAPDVVLGNNAFSLQVGTAATADPLLAVTLSGTLPFTPTLATIYPDATARSHELTHRIGTEGDIELRQAVLHAPTLKPLYMRPPLRSTVISTLAELDLTCSGEVEIWLGSERLHAGPAAPQGTRIPCPLGKGANALRIWCAGRISKAQIILPGEKAPAETRWKTKALPRSQAADTTLDDRTWPTLQPTVDAPAAAAGGILLQHTVLWENTRLWPTPDPAWHMVSESAQHLTFLPHPPGNHPLQDWSLTLAVPAQVEVLGATGYYATSRDFQPHYSVTAAGAAELQGVSCNLYRISADKPMRRQSHYIFGVVNVFVRHSGGPAATAEPRFHYWTEANDGTVREAPQAVAVRVLPPLRGQQPQQLTWQLWGSFFGAMDDPNMKEETLKTARAAGFNDLVAGDRWSSDTGPRYGISNTRGIRFVSWSLDLAPFLEAHADARLLDADGNRSTVYMCTSSMLAENWEAVQEQLAKVSNDSGAHTLDYDFEYSPLTGPHSCYCPRCLDAFRAAADLPAAAVLNAEAIRENHKDAWTDFMARRVAEVLKRMKDGTHAVGNGVTFSTYSGYQTKTNPLQYGIDWRYIGDLGAADHVGCGYGRPVPAISDTITALQGIPAVFGILVRPYSTEEIVPLNPITKALVLRRSLDASGGILVYDRLPLDGRCWLALAEASRLVAQFETDFLQGQRLPLETQPADQVTLLQGSENRLLFVLNTGSAERTFSFTPPFSGTDFYSGTAMQAGRLLELKLAAGDAAVFVSAAAP